MKITRLIVLIIFGILLFGLVSCVPSSGGNIKEDRLVGRYALVIENDSHHGFGNYIEIESLGKGMIKGKIGIDWSLGPEGRAPLVWETMYESGFSAKLSDKTFSFDAEAATAFEKYAAVYQFVFRISERQNGYFLDGTVSIRQNTDEASKASIHKTSAHKTSEEG
jgi:hypothetical protein